ncbi:adenosylmethionine--8-amino-7-oxononanoate transaminase (plasmid) [Azospirillum argentinense]|uniref:Adenosylmethionine-8-amino-7-oxononanoate aminotransferase n=1 Tax=Azospirillum argentinense TaxID=2970906 RepID=A0A4D8PKM0_9PROT|nr:adenosylmethionine--8-amino-7-oxononanoate transaminase [Azospirillum argentinense]QCN99053.1 adenosylmethionine--8-amino-7-oxononanoate transaminase [Azospirillum argentinense]
MTDTVSLDRRHVWHPFTQAQTAPEPLAVTHGKGVSLFTEDGREILDLISSWWVNLHGHAHPAIAGAIAEQAHRLEQVIFADFTHSPAARLAARLAEVLPGGLDRVFYSDNGSTAVEVALKLAWQYWRNKGEAQRRRFLAFEGSYHGDTFGAMAAGVGSGFYAPFQELLFAVDRMPYPATWDGDPEVEAKEAAALDWLDRWLAANGAEMVAVIIEPLVQGASGMRFCRPEFLRAMAARVRAAGGLVIFDEVMTGFGRTGALFASQKAGVAPDLICLSKGLTGGFLPLSVTACGASIYEAFLGAGFDRAFAHGHSFTANPLGCAAALASLELTTSAETAANLARIEAQHRAAIAELSSHPKLSRGRVLGTIAAIEVTDAQGYTAAVGQTLKRFFLERGLLLRPLGPVIYLLPPYCVTDGQLDRAYAAIRDAADTLL